MFTTKNSTPKYNNPWMNVREDIVVDQAGQEKTYGVVTMLKGATILAMDTNKNIYLAKLYRYGLKADSIECPGGAIDEGESPLEAAKRELQEELGITAETWLDMGHVNPLTSIVTHTEYLFFAKDLTVPKKIPYSDDEAIELVHVSFEEAVRMVNASEITHGPSVALVYRVNEWMGKHD